ncbi:hypothetical protein [Desulfotomaculum sp. 1211_IL3151]|uniref:hypothetical protein n=1 Tax=Desulfotomaculum sp. 1211_IL3151 TaxID=3084055 RepID=UPI002FD8E9FB
MVNINQNIYQKKEKLVKWYGWIVILIICITPLVILLLPKLMLNVGRINKILRESIVPNNKTLNGKVINIAWQKHNDGDIGCIDGDIEIESVDASIVQCKFKKYVGPKFSETFQINKYDQILVNGSYQDNIFLIRNLGNLTNQHLYTSEPQVSVY